MKKFIDKNFLLKTETAKLLYENYASKLPIIDYHCHIKPKDIAENTHYSNITELWLSDDHYKWRAMRSCGVQEKYITGDASAYEIFKAYATCMPKLIGNPLYHWSHLELKRYFGYDGILNASTCDYVWKTCNDILNSQKMSAKNIIVASNVEAICTTDDPIDSLEYHKIIKNDFDFKVKVLPAFRPDKVFELNGGNFKAYIDALSSVTMIRISNIDELKEALIKRIEYFDELGCVTADHGLEYIPFAVSESTEELNKIFSDAYKNNGGISKAKCDKFITFMLTFLGKEYTKRKWVMQLHYGVMREPNSVALKSIGVSAGFDIIGDSEKSITNIARLLDKMQTNNALPRTVIYPINPTENNAVATLIGAYQLNSDGNMPRVMQGSAWWFNDNLIGMRNQMLTLASLSVFGNFLGMLTDSRSLLSYTRHEYFRRILCDLIGEWVENGEYPYDIEALSNIVTDICYLNTKNFFGF